MYVHSLCINLQSISPIVTHVAPLTVLCRDRAVGIATPNYLDGPGIEFPFGVKFSAPVLTGLGAQPDRAWGPPSLLYNGYSHSQ